MTHGPEEVNVAVALLLPAVVATLSSAISPSDVILRDVNPLPAALLVVITVFAPKRWHFYVPKSVPHFDSAIRLSSLIAILVATPSLAVSASSTITLVQHASSDASTTSTTVLVFPSNNTAGNWIGVCTRAGAANESFTVVDSKGNVYRKAIQYSETNDGNSFGIYYAENIAGGANTIRVSDTATATLRVAILEYSGVATSGSLDVIAAAQGHNATPNSGATGSTTASGELLVGTVMTANSARFTAGSGYATVESVPARAANEVARGKRDTGNGRGSDRRRKAGIDGFLGRRRGGIQAGDAKWGVAPSITSTNSTTFTPPAPPAAGTRRLVIFHKSLNKNNPTLPDEANDRAFYSKKKNEFFLMYDDVRLSANPEKILLDFLPKHLRSRRHSRKGGSRKSRSKRRKELISAASIRIHTPRSRHPLLNPLLLPLVKVSSCTVTPVVL